MPHQEEILENGSPQWNDRSLILPEDLAMIDCLVVGMKDPSVEFNKPLRSPAPSAYPWRGSTRAIFQVLDESWP